MNLKLFIEAVKNMKKSRTETLQYVYEFVRDEILFDFLPEIDDISPEEVFQLRRGQCNNKSILFFEILKRLEFDAVVHFSTIDKRIHRGFFPTFLLFFVPNQIGHSWIEVMVDGKMVILDGFINDQRLFQGSVIRNQQKNWDIGHSVASWTCGASSEFSLENDSYVQMEGVIEDLGTTINPRHWLNSEQNPNRVNFLKKLMYRLFLPTIRKRVQQTRLLST